MNEYFAFDALSKSIINNCFVDRLQGPILQGAWKFYKICKSYQINPKSSAWNYF